MNRYDKQIEHYRYNYKKGRIGKGSYATVFKGVDLDTKQFVAIKQIHKVDLQSQDGEEHLLNEINMLKRIRSPNIIEIQDVLQTKDHYYIVLEYCNLGDLDSLLKQKNVISFDDHVVFLTDILNAFTILIRQGVAHRDLKPANILVHQEGKRKIFKLADFGYAKTILNYHAQILKSNLGTPAYMSPQLLKEENYTTKSDVWSFGIILYQIIYNHLPWQGKSEIDLLAKIQNNPLTFPAVPKISKNLQDLISNCLKPEEEERYNWNDVYRHPYVCKYFGKINIQQNTCLRKVYILSQSIREKLVKESNADALLKELQIKDNLLNQDEFGMFFNLAKVGNLSEEDIKFLFLEFQNEGKVNYSEFKAVVFYNPPKRVKIVRHLSNSNIKILSKLAVSLKQFDVKLLFESFATTKKDALERHQFSRMIKMLANTSSLTNQNIKEIIDFFDDNGDGMIQFTEFTNVLKYVQQIENTSTSDNKLDAISEIDEISFYQDEPKIGNIDNMLTRKSIQKFSICECTVF